jgi:hypothetical protein
MTSHATNALRRFSIFIIALLLGSAFSPSALAWGRRGHAIVCETAATLLSEQAVMKKHSFDLGYECNVPDLVWKKPATYAIEAPQHFMDLEIFSRAFAQSSHDGDPFALSRGDFEKAYPSIPVSAGRAYWRIRELMDRLDADATALKNAGASKPSASKTAVPSADIAARQEDWLITAGAIGHYVGDLAQPLHVTENYDGKMSGQKGIHSFFEDRVVDELAVGARLQFDVAAAASKKWKDFDRRSKKLSTLELIERLASESNASIAELLKIDKRVGRKDIKKTARAFRPMIRDRMAAGALVLAELWSRELDWTYHGEKFYNFAASPEYIPPGTNAAPPTVPSAVQPAPPPAEAPAGRSPKP